MTNTDHPAWTLQAPEPQAPISPERARFLINSLNYKSPEDQPDTAYRFLREHLAREVLEPMVADVNTHRARRVAIVTAAYAMAQAALAQEPGGH